MDEKTQSLQILNQNQEAMQSSPKKLPVNYRSYALLIFISFIALIIVLYPIIDKIFITHESSGLGIINLFLTGVMGFPILWIGSTLVYKITTKLFHIDKVNSFSIYMISAFITSFSFLWLPLWWIPLYADAILRHSISDLTATFSFLLLPLSWITELIK